eukprot:Skav216298  [mRNA]  locus=scaffold494:120735:126516:- [translate_table: standard]
MTEEMEDDFDDMVDAEVQEVTVLQRSKSTVMHLEAPPRREYYMKMYKPYGVICSRARDVLDAPIVSDLYPPGAEACHSYRCDRLLRTRIGCITGIPKAKAEKYLAVPAQEITTAQLGDPMDLQSGEWLGAAIFASNTLTHQTLDFMGHSLFGVRE